MSYCSYCGASLNDEAKFCHECGKAIQIEKDYEKNGEEIERTEGIYSDLKQTPNDGTFEKFKSFLVHTWRKSDIFLKIVYVVSFASVIALPFALLISLSSARGFLLFQSIFLTITVLIHTGKILKSLQWLKYMGILLSLLLVFLIIQNGVGMFTMNLGLNKEYHRETDTGELSEKEEVKKETKEQEKSVIQTDNKEKDIKQAPKERIEKNGYNQATNKDITVGDYKFSVPSYWIEKEQEDNIYTAFAEEKDKVAMFQIQVTEGSFGYSSLEDTEKARKELFERMMKEMGLPFSNVTSEFIEQSNNRGYLFSSDTTIKNYDSKLKMLFVNTSQSNTWALVMLVQTNNTDYSYISDYEKIIASIVFTGEQNVKKYPVYFSTNTEETVNNGNTGVYSYIKTGPNYDTYYILDFDEGYAYYFLDGEEGQVEETCEKTSMVSGSLNDVVILKHVYGDEIWYDGLRFKYKDVPLYMIYEDVDSFEWEFTATDLKMALEKMSKKSIVEH